MTSHLVVAPPMEGGVRACAQLASAGISTTLVWHDEQALREVADSVVGLGGDELRVRPAVLQECTAAMAHWLMTHSGPVAITLVADLPEHVEVVVGIGHMVLRHLPPIPTYLGGEACDALEPVARSTLASLELPRIEAFAGLLPDLNGAGSNVPR